MEQWYKVQPDQRTPEQNNQRKIDYAHVFYGGTANMMVFAELCEEIDGLPTSDGRNILRDFFLKIKGTCGMVDYKKLIEAESKSLT